MIAVCSLCCREIEIEPFGRPESFHDLCDPCTRGIEARNPGLKLGQEMPQDRAFSSANPGGKGE